MQRAGELPDGIVGKMWVLMAPSTRRGLGERERLGASTANIPSDVTIDQLAELRASSSLPLDLYVESLDALGGVVRGNELGDLVRAGAPLYAKFGLRNARMIYPSGAHLVDEACAIAREKVHRAAAALEWLGRLRPGPVQAGPRAPGPGGPRETGGAGAPRRRKGGAKP